MKRGFLLLALGIGLAGGACHDEQRVTERAKQAAKEARKDTEKAVAEVSKDLIESKDDFIRKVRSDLNVLDLRIADLEGRSRVYTREDRQDLDTMMADLRTARTALEAALSTLTNQETGAWADARGTVEAALDRLRRVEATASAKLGQPGPDTELARKVQARLLRDRMLKADHVMAEAANGLVTLRGEVESEAARLRALDLARKTEGAKDVIDQLAVVPGSAP
jgi:hyperosmotically inducible protein